MKTKKIQPVLDLKEPVWKLLTLLETIVRYKARGTGKKIGYSKVLSAVVEEALLRQHKEILDEYARLGLGEVAARLGADHDPNLAPRLSSAAAAAESAGGAQVPKPKRAGRKHKPAFFLSG